MQVLIASFFCLGLDLRLAWFWWASMNRDEGPVYFPAKGRKIASRKISFPFFVVCFVAKHLAKYNSHFPLAVATVKFVVI